MVRLIYLFIAYLPFQISFSPFKGVDLSSLRLFIVFLFLAWLILGIARRSLRVSPSFITWGLLFFLFLAVVSLFFAEQSFWGLRKLLYFCSIFPLYFLISDPASKIDFKKIVKILTISGLVVAILGLAQFLLQFFVEKGALVEFWADKIGPIFYGKSLGGLVAQNPSWLVNIEGRTFLRSFAFFPDPHMLSFYLGMILPFALVVRKRFNFLASGIILVCLLLTFSRGGYLGILISFLLLLFFSWAGLSSRQKSAIFFLGLLGVALIFVFAGPTLGRFLSIFNLEEGSNIGRIKIWQESLEFWRAAPIFGVGLGNYPAQSDWNLDYWSPVTSHNLYLDILTEMGFFALACWLFLIFGTIFWLIKRFKNSKNVYLLAPFSSLIYFSVHSFFETAIFNPIILALLMVVLGLGTKEAVRET